jgi:hypothetical protein
VTWTKWRCEWFGIPLGCDVAICEPLILMTWICIVSKSDVRLWRKSNVMRFFMSGSHHVVGWLYGFLFSTRPVLITVCHVWVKIRNMFFFFKFLQFKFGKYILKIFLKQKNLENVFRNIYLKTKIKD